MPTELDLVRAEISDLKIHIAAIMGGLRGDKKVRFSELFEVNNEIERQVLQKNLFERNRLLKEIEEKLKRLKKD